MSSKGAVYWTKQYESIDARLRVLTFGRARHPHAACNCPYCPYSQENSSRDGPSRLDRLLHRHSGRGSLSTHSTSSNAGDIDGNAPDSKVKPQRNRSNSTTSKPKLAFPLIAGLVEGSDLRRAQSVSSPSKTYPHNGVSKGRRSRRRYLDDPDMDMDMDLGDNDDLGKSSSKSDHDLLCIAQGAGKGLDRTQLLLGGTSYLQVEFEALARRLAALERLYAVPTHAHCDCQYCQYGGGGEAIPAYDAYQALGSAQPAPERIAAVADPSMDRRQRAMRVQESINDMASWHTEHDYNPPRDSRRERKIATPRPDFDCPSLNDTSQDTKTHLAQFPAHWQPDPDFALPANPASESMYTRDPGGGGQRIDPRLPLPPPRDTSIFEIRLKRVFENLCARLVVLERDSGGVPPPGHVCHCQYCASVGGRRRVGGVVAHAACLCPECPFGVPLREKGREL